MGGDYVNGGDGDDLMRVHGPIGGYIDGGAGSDTLVAGSSGADWMEGGAGADHFRIVAMGGMRQEDADVILDWESSDRMMFYGVTTAGGGAAAGQSVAGASMGGNEISILPMTYSEFVADSYEAALRIANEHIAFAQAKWVAAQVGDDVFVFADVGDPWDGADAVVCLTGTSLSEIGLGNFSLI